MESLTVRNRKTVRAAEEDPSKYGKLLGDNWGLMVRVVAQNLPAAEAEGLDFQSLMSVAVDTMISDSGKYDPARNDNFAAFICICMHSRIRQAIDHQRRVNKRIRVISFDDRLSSQSEITIGETVSVAGDHDAVLERIFLGWRWGQIGPLIRELEPLERRVLYLYFWEDLTYRDIARVIDTSYEWVRKVRNRAIEKLRSALKERGLLPAE